MSPTLITLLVTAGLQYGPEFVMSIIAIIENPNATVADVKAAFVNLKPYSAYNIPNIPTAPIATTSVVLPTIS